MSTPPDKFCERCGRRIEWRKKWERDWENVKYCSKSCRSSGLKDVDHELEAAIMALLCKRGASSSICPSEAAQRVGGASEDDWRPLMEPARMAARRLVNAGKAQITQKKRVVDPSTARGPIRVRLAR